MSKQNYKAFKSDLKLVRNNIESFENVDECSLEDTKRNRDYLIHTTINMVERRSYVRKGMVRGFIDFDDLIQNGILGAMDALDRWFRKSVDERKEFPNFKTFAYIWVEKHIKEYIDNNSYSVTHGIKQVNDLHKNYHVYSGDEIGGLTGDGIPKTKFDFIAETLSDEGVNNDHNIDTNLKSMVERSIGEYDTKILFSYFGFGGETKQDVARVLNKDVGSLNKYCKKLINKIKNNISKNETDLFLELMSDSL